MSAAAKGLILFPEALTRLNPGDMAADISLSDDKLTVSKISGAAWRTVRSEKSATQGKIYFEVTNNVAGTASLIGVANAAFALANGPGTIAGTDSIGCASNDGTMYYNTGGPIVPGTWNTAGAFCCCAIDLDARRIWFRPSANGNWNNLSTRTPEDPATGYDISAGNLGAANAIFLVATVYGATNTATANFGQTAFQGVVPNGYRGLR